MSDPFAPPKSLEPPEKPVGHVFRAGDTLVIPMGRPEWPDACVRCGEAAPERAREMFAHSPRITWFLAVVVGIGVGQATGWMPLAFLAMALVIWIPSTVRTLPVPACPRHRPGILVARGMYAASVGLFGVVMLPIGDWLKVGLMVAALAGIVVAVAIGSRLSTSGIADGYVQVRGAHPDLLRWVPDVEASLRR